MANPIPKVAVQAVGDYDDEILTYLRVLFAEVNYVAIALARERASKKGKGRKKDPPLTKEQLIRKKKMDEIKRIDRKIKNARV